MHLTSFFRALSGPPGVPICLDLCLLLCYRMERYLFGSTEGRPCTARSAVGWGTAVGGRTPAPARRRRHAAFPLQFRQAFSEVLEKKSAHIYRGVLAFLTGTGSHSECDVTYSKQTFAPFLTETRTASTSSTRRSIFSPLFTSNLQSRLRDLPCNLRNSSAHFLPNFFLGLMLDSEIVFL